MYLHPIDKPRAPERLPVKATKRVRPCSLATPLSKARRDGGRACAQDDRHTKTAKRGRSSSISATESFSPKGALASPRARQMSAPPGLSEHIDTPECNRQWARFLDISPDERYTAVDTDKKREMSPSQAVAACEEACKVMLNAVASPQDSPVYPVK